MQDQATKPAVPTSSPSRRRLLRTTWAGAVATVTAGGLLFAAVPSIPDPHAPGEDRDLPARFLDAFRSVPAVRAETTPRNVTPDQIVAVLARADQQAREQGPDLSPAVAQAAAELGMLYTTYQIQQPTPGETIEALRVEDAPVARARGAKAPPSVVTVSAGYDATTEPETAAQPALAELGADRVTYDEVVLAAVRLANMLDPSVPGTLVEVQPADQHQAARDGTTAGAPGGRGGPGLTLRQSLFDVVTTFGDSTLSYANGRIPASVLCPLDFAGGHMLRCDAAERLEALSEKFEDEFGHPIPITDSYRSYVAQVAVAGAKPHLAAVPGTSNHGWGLAVDLGAPISGGASAEYVWLRVHGPDYGWDNPSWARPGGTKPEPWHFEFFAAGAVPDRAVDPSDVGTWGSDDTTEPADDEGPRYEAAAATSGGTKDRSPADDAAPPSAKPADKPGKNPPAQKPTKPKPKPSPKPTPSEPKPTPKPPVTSPSPSPTPEPSPSPSPSVPPSPSPSVPAPSPTPEPSASSPAPTPAPSEEQPSPTPEPTPSGSEKPASPAPSPSPSATRESLLGLAKDLGLTDDEG